MTCLTNRLPNQFCTVFDALMCSSTRVVGSTSFGVSHLQQRSHRLRKVRNTELSFRNNVIIFFSQKYAT